MVLFADARRWNPAGLEGLMTALAATRDALLEAGYAVAGPITPPGWLGEAAGSAATDRDLLTIRLRGLAERLDTLRPGLGYAIDEITALRRGFADTEAVATVLGFALTPDGGVVDTRPPPPTTTGTPADDERRIAQIGIRDQLADLLRRTGSVDTDLAVLLMALSTDAASVSATPPSGRPTDPAALRALWMALALQQAGIDDRTWDPARGAGELSEVIEKVYAYYGELYLQHPELQWAGMANLIGPSFAAGFSDLDQIRGVAQLLEFLPGVPGMSALAADLDLRFYETTFLDMQKEIFFDQAMMHEAYLNGGMPAIRELRQAGLIDTPTEFAWSQIDEGKRSGDQELLAAGNVGLLRREQQDIIDDDYQRMYDHPVTGPAFTYVMTAVGDPSIPGAQSYGEYDPVSGTPLPAGNIAGFDQRWPYIVNDTLPAYQDLLRDDPERLREIVGSDVGDRIEENRLYNRFGELAEQYTSGWIPVFDR